MNEMATIDSDKALIVLPDIEDRAALMTLFTGEYDVTIGPLLKHIEKAVHEFKSHKHDARTDAGRKAIGKFDYKLARSKTALDGAGKAVVAVLKEMPKKIDANRKVAREMIEGWQTEITAPVKAWDDAEDERKNRHLAAVTNIVTLGTATEGKTAAELRMALTTVEIQVVDASCEEFEREYALARTNALGRITGALEAREQYDADQAELAALRAHKAEQEAKEEAAREAREAKERQEREEHAAAERFARDRRDAIARLAASADVEHVAAAGILSKIERLEKIALLPETWGDFLGEARLAYDTTLASLRKSLVAAEAREAAAKAEQDAQAAKLATEAAERRRLEDEAGARREADEEAAQRARIAEAKLKADEAAAAARAADEDHRRNINREALAALALLVPGGGAKGNETAAKVILTAIIKGAVPHVTVNY